MEGEILKKDPENPAEKHFELKSENFKSIELFWDEIIVTAKIKEKRRTYQKTLLNNVKGVAIPGNFSAIIGPSGCGKTTLLNFLSGRLYSKNLKGSGIFKINGNLSGTIQEIGNQIAYVMQDDILFATFTPREAFTFTAKLRLGHLSQQKITEKVDFYIKILGLNDCADIRVGNNLIRGISGGERKRTSIGVELLTNPSVIFLDEPTTGLDSASALKIILILKDLAKEGRTIISTIHQPSSEIFETFDQLLLLVKGEVIYQGPASECIEYFRNDLQLIIPEFCNPATFLMKCMNPEGLLVQHMQETRNFNIKFDENIHKDFDERLKKMVTTYNNSSYFGKLSPSEKQPIPINKSINQSNWLTQFKQILLRAFKNEIRNPFDIRNKLASTLIFSAVCIIVFEGLGNYRQGIQNRSGAIFFITMQNIFASIMGSLMIFSAEKPVFLRESFNKTYSTSAYFWGRTLSELPFHFLFPTILVSVVYYAIGLNDAYPWKILYMILIQNGVYFYGVSFGLLMSIVFPNAEMALALVPVTVIPFLVFAGFFVNQNNVPYYFYPIQYISMVKYGFQASVMNEFQDINYYCTPNVICQPLDEFNFPENFRDSIIILWSLGVAFRFICYIFLRWISAPKIHKIIPDKIKYKDNQILPK